MKPLPLLLLVACAGDKSDPVDSQPPVCEDPGDPALRVTHLQALGTHNSYHVEPAQPVDDSHRYTHAPLDEQLGRLGVRQFELDLHLREGVGFEVFHLPNLDDVTTCLALTDCLAVMKAWSDANPCHAPLMVWLEPKDDLDGLVEGLSPILGRTDELEAEILSVWPRGRIIAPDDVRGGHATLPEGVAAGGWPSLADSRGKVIFSMLDSGEHRDAYVAGAEALEGRLLFVDASTVTDPFAATLKLDNPTGDAEAISAAVAGGFLVTGNVDSLEADDASNQARVDAALGLGLHFLAGDLVEPGDGFSVVIPGGNPARCNAVTAPEGCTSAGIEDL